MGARLQLEASTTCSRGWDPYRPIPHDVADHQVPRAYNGCMPGKDTTSTRGRIGPSDADVLEAEHAILATLATYPDGDPPTPRELERAASMGRPSEVMTLAFWRLVKRGQLVFDGRAKIKPNDIPPRA